MSPVSVLVLSMLSTPALIIVSSGGATLRTERETLLALLLRPLTTEAASAKGIVPHFRGLWCGPGIVRYPRRSKRGTWSAAMAIQGPDDDWEKGADGVTMRADK